MRASDKAFQCAKCKVVLEVDLEANPVRLSYDHEAWRKACVHADADGLPTCPEMIDLVRDLMGRRGGNGHLGY